MSENDLVFWFLLLILGIPGILIGGLGIASGIKWLLEQHADRIDARRRHQVALERERTRQLEAQRARDDAIWQRALEEHEP